jgi:hypothetical protein
MGLLSMNINLECQPLHHDTQRTQALLEIVNVILKMFVITKLDIIWHVGFILYAADLL